MQNISKQHSVLTMCAAHEAHYRAHSGDTLVFETMDCFSNTLEKETDRFSTVPWDRINPATGPVYFEEACPGDTLKVEILQIDLAEAGVSAMCPGFGTFADKIRKEVTRIFPIEEGCAVFSDTLRLPVRPMIGVIGTAPAEGLEIPTGTPGPHGGNMDCKEICAGTTLYLPVNTAGGLLAMGDVHAVMGDGEVSVCGLEIAARVTVRVTVEKGQKLPLPFLTNDTHVMAIYSAATLDEAAEGAAFAMHRYLTEQKGMDAHEAMILLSLAGDLRICQVVDPLKTCRMELSAEILSRL